MHMHFIIHFQFRQLNVLGVRGPLSQSLCLKWLLTYLRLSICEPNPMSVFSLIFVHFISQLHSILKPEEPYIKIL